MPAGSRESQDGAALFGDDRPPVVRDVQPDLTQIRHLAATQGTRRDPAQKPVDDLDLCLQVAGQLSGGRSITCCAAEVAIVSCEASAQYR